jgi:O-antigen ligase
MIDDTEPDGRLAGRQGDDPSGPSRQQRVVDALAVLFAWLIPLAYLPSDNSYSFAPKYAVLICAGAVGFLPLVRIARSPSSPLRWPARAAVAFLLVSGLSAILSPQPLIGIFGLYAWGTGWLFWFGSAGMFALGAGSSPAAKPKIHNALIVGVTLNAAIALLQATVHLPSAFALGLYRGEADGLMGNPVFLEGLLLGCLGMIFEACCRGGRRALGLVAALCAAALELSGERLALLLLFGLVALALIRHRRAGFGFAVPVLFGYGAGYVIRAGVAKRLLGTTSATFSVRLRVWRIGLRAIAHRPLLGWGPGQTRDAVHALQGVAFARLVYPLGVLTDEHNIVLEVAVTTGLAGLTCFLAWVLGAMRHARGPLFFFALLLGATALIEPLDVGTTPLALLALGAAVLQPEISPPRPLRRPARFAGAAALLVFLGAAALLVRGDAELSSAAQSLRLSEAVTARDLLPIWPTPASVEARADALIWLNHHRRRSLVQSVAAARSAAHLDTGDPVLWVTLGQGEEQLGRNALAAAAFRHALRVDPLWPPADIDLGELDLRRHENRAAAALFRSGLAVDPNSAVLRSDLSRAVHHNGVRGERPRPSSRGGIAPLGPQARSAVRVPHRVRRITP